MLPDDRSCPLNRLWVLGALIALSICSGCGPSQEEDLLYPDVEFVQVGGLVSARVQGSHLQEVFLKLPDGKIKRCSEVTPDDVRLWLPPLPDEPNDGVVTHGDVFTNCALKFENGKPVLLIVGGNDKLAIGRSPQGPFLKEPIEGIHDPRIHEVFGAPTSKRWHSRPHL